MLRPPLGELQFDEDNLWYLVELDVRAEHIEGEANAFATDFVLEFLQRQQPLYTIGPWIIYTPDPEDLFPTGVAQAIRVRREQFRASAAVPLPHVQPRLSHWAATLRGYRAWPMGPGNNATCSLPDIGGWAGDLLNAWNDYFLNHRTGYTGTIRQWFRANVGSDDAGGRFSAEDLKSDIDAFLCKLMQEPAVDRPLSDYVREIEWECSLDQNWRYARFYQQRFDGSRSVVEAATKDIFESGAIWVHFPVQHFIDQNARMPTAVEAVEIAQGFADALIDRI